MKKKIVVGVISLVMCAGIVACGTDSQSQNNDSVEKQETEVVVTAIEEESETESTTDKETAIPTVEIMEEIGEGAMYIATPSGTSEDGNIPIFYVSNETDYEELSLYTEEFDGSLLTFIYVDGELKDKDQLSDANISVGIEDVNLLIGVHAVEVKQFVDNDENGELVTYKVAQYETMSE